MYLYLGGISGWGLAAAVPAPDHASRGIVPKHLEQGEPLPTSDLGTVLPSVEAAVPGELPSTEHWGSGLWEGRRIVPRQRWPGTECVGPVEGGR